MSDTEWKQLEAQIDDYVKCLEFPTIKELLTDIDNLKQRIEVD